MKKYNALHNCRQDKIAISFNKQLRKVRKQRQMSGSKILKRAKKERETKAQLQQLLRVSHVSPICPSNCIITTSHFL